MGADPVPGLAGEPAVTRLQQWMFPFSAAVAVLGMIIAGAKMALTRKASPLIDAGSGLVTIAATSAVGVLLPSLLLKAGDAWSDWVLNASTGGQFGARLTSLLALTGVTAPAVVVVLGIVAIVISAVQAMLMLFRQGALVVLAGLLPLAAAGTLTPATRPWFRKTTGWMLALIFYKPAAAAVYATAFTLIGAGKDLRTVLTGFAMVLMSLLALPVLMRFFTWTTGAVADSAAGGGFSRRRSPVPPPSERCAAPPADLGEPCRAGPDDLGPARPGSGPAAPRHRRRGPAAGGSRPYGAAGHVPASAGAAAAPRSAGRRLAGCRRRRRRCGGSAGAGPRRRARLAGRPGGRRRLAAGAASARRRPRRPWQPGDDRRSQ